MSVKLKNESFTTVSATGTITGLYDLYFVDATAGSVVLTLPASTSMLLGRNLTFKRIDTATGNTVTVQRGGADTIDGLTSVLLDVTNVLVLVRSDITAWRSLQLEGSVGSQNIVTVTGTGTLDGSADLYLVNISAAATLTLPAASAMVQGKQLRFRRIDTTNFVCTLSRAGSDTLTLTNSAVATTTTINASEGLALTRTSSTAWTLTSARPTYLTLLDAGAAAVTVSGAYDVWIVNSTAADRVVTLPAIAVGGVGKIYYIVNTGSANNAVITPAGGETINGGGTLNVAGAATGNGRAIIAATATNWIAMN